MIMSTPTALFHKESLHRGSVVQGNQGVGDLLESGESRTVEVKGSAFSSLNRRLHDPRDRPEPSDVTVESLRRCIVGFLNADGGTVLIGAVDGRRHQEQAALSSAPKIGDFVVCGVNAEMRHNWDDYEHRLLQAIRTGIEPEPSVALLSIERELIEDRIVCTVTVRPSSHTWFYSCGTRRDRSPKFYVRTGALTGL